MFVYYTIIFGKKHRNTPFFLTFHCGLKPPQWIVLNATRFILLYIIYVNCRILFLIVFIYFILFFFPQDFRTFHPRLKPMSAATSSAITVCVTVYDEQRRERRERVNGCGRINRGPSTIRTVTVAGDRWNRLRRRWPPLRPLTDVLAFIRSSRRHRCRSSPPTNRVAPMNGLDATAAAIATIAVVRITATAVDSATANAAARTTATTVDPDRRRLWRNTNVYTWIAADDYSYGGHAKSPYSRPGHGRTRNIFTPTHPRTPTTPTPSYELRIHVGHTLTIIPFPPDPTPTRRSIGVTL